MHELPSTSISEITFLNANPLWPDWLNWFDIPFDITQSAHGSSVMKHFDKKRLKHIPSRIWMPGNCGSYVAAEMRTFQLDSTAGIWNSSEEPPHRNWSKKQSAPGAAVCRSTDRWHLIGFPWRRRSLRLDIYMYIPRSVHLQWIAAVPGWSLTSNDSPQSWLERTHSRSDRWVSLPILRRASCGRAGEWSTPWSALWTRRA